MAEYIWCHGPKCHEDRTQDRIKGSKGSKVLRTRKIKQTEWNKDHYFRYFCSQGCMHNFIHIHMQRIVALAPRYEPLETPINDPVKTDQAYYGQYSITERGVDNE